LWSDETWERFPTRTARGADDIASMFDAAFAALPDFVVRIVELAEQGDNVFVRWKVTGTHTGASWEGVAPSGKRVELDGIDHFVVRDGRVVSNFIVFDQLQFAQPSGSCRRPERWATARSRRRSHCDEPPRHFARARSCLLFSSRRAHPSALQQCCPTAQLNRSPRP